MRQNFYSGFNSDPRQINFVEAIKHNFNNGSMLTKLIYINVFIYVFLLFANLVFWLANTPNPVLKWLMVPANTTYLLQKPWSLITYMFTHESFFHLLFNMLWLHWLGSIFVKLFNEKKLLYLYIVGGLAGALLFILAYNFMPQFNLDVPNDTLGASASVMAIVFAVAIYQPEYSLNLLFFGRIKLFHFAIALIVLDLLMMPKGNAGGHIAHIGGALAGVLGGLWQRNIGSRQASQTGNADYDYNLKRNSKDEQINEILDKISKSGYESLTKEERRILFKSNNS